MALPWTPKQGALLVCGLGWDRGSAANPTIGASWTEFKSQTGASTKQLICAYRYVQVGDTSTLPALVSSGSNFYSQMVCEITGVSGTFASDHVGNDYSGHQASGASMTTTADTTTANNQLALTFFVNYNAGALPSISGTGWMAPGWVDSGGYGGWMVGLQSFPTSGSSVSATLTPGLTSDHQAYIQTLWSSGAAAAGLPNALLVSL